MFLFSIFLFCSSKHAFEEKQFRMSEGTPASCSISTGARIGEKNSGVSVANGFLLRTREVTTKYFIVETVFLGTGFWK